MWSDFSDGGHALAFSGKNNAGYLFFHGDRWDPNHCFHADICRFVDAILWQYRFIGSLGFVILFADTICAEIEQGTLINLITKGLPRQTILLAKTLYLYFLWTLFYAAAFLICLLYTRIYFNDSLTHHLISAGFSYWLFGLLSISLLLLSSAFAKNVYQVLLFLAAFMVLAYWAVSLNLQKINPYSLSSQTIAYIQGNSELMDFLPAVLIAVVGSFLSLIISRSIFQKALD